MEIVSNTYLQSISVSVKIVRKGTILWHGRAAAIQQYNVSTKTKY